MSRAEGVNSRFIGEFLGLVQPVHGSQQLAYGLHFIQRVRRNNASARVLDRGLKLAPGNFELLDLRWQVYPEAG